MAQTGETTDNAISTRCLECGNDVTTEERVTTKDGVFCKSCYEALLGHVERIVRENSENINYPLAVLGALAGGTLGTVLWWGSTILTHTAFGLIAIVIGILVAKGIMIATGGKRSRGAQGIAVTVTALAYFYGDFLVSRSFVIKEHPDFADKLSLLPNPMIIYEICRLHVMEDAFGLVFLGIAIWQAYRMTQPVSFKR